MKRIVYYDLLRWRHQTGRKPLLLRGARQTGKTHIVRQLGKTFSHYVEINFEKTPGLAKIFELDLDPVRITREISLFVNKQIKPGSTLLFIDEIQQVPAAIIALRYFYEDMPELHVIAAGSLVDFAIEQVGVPVGRLSFLYMYPMSFIEFLCAKGASKLAEAIITNKNGNPFVEPIHVKALRLLGEYMAVGGMPKAVHEWVKDQNIYTCVNTLTEIKNTYEQDFSKYANKNEIKYVDHLFRHIPRFICQHFKFSHISPDFRKRELEPALWLLEKAGIINQVLHSSGNGIPLGAEADLQKYKLIMLDIGLNQQILGLNLKDWFIEPAVNLVNKGALAENFVGQEILAYANSTTKQQLYYWHREKKRSHAEVDYLVNIERNIIPIEVKSGQGTTMQSMRIFLESHPDSPWGIRFSIHNYSFFDNIYSLPLYAVCSITENRERLLELLE